MQSEAVRSEAPVGTEAHHNLLRFVGANVGAIALGLTIAYLALPWRETVGIIRWSDFIAFYGAARLAIEGHADHMYSFEALRQVQTQVYYPYKPPGGFMVYVYPPFFALLMAPFAVLPFTLAYSLRLLTNLLLLTATLYWLQGYARLTGRSAAITRWAGLTFLPVFICLIEGQCSLLLLALFTGILLALRAGAGRRAGIMLAMALIKPPFVLPMLVVLLVRRETVALRWFLAMGAALFVVPILLFGPGATASYIHTLVLATGWHNQFGYEPTKSSSFFGFWALLLPQTPALLAGAACSVLIIAALAFCARRSDEVDIPVALAAVCALLANPHVLVHDLTLLILPAYILIRRRNELGRRLPAALASGYILIAAGYPLAFSVPLQLSTIVMSASALCLYRLTDAKVRVNRTVSPA